MWGGRLGPQAFGSSGFDAGKHEHAGGMKVNEAFYVGWMWVPPLLAASGRLLCCTPPPEVMQGEDYIEDMLCDRKDYVAAEKALIVNEIKPNKPPAGELTQQAHRPPPQRYMFDDDLDYLREKVKADMDFMWVSFWGALALGLPLCRFACPIPAIPAGCAWAAHCKSHLTSCLSGSICLDLLFMPCNAGLGGRDAFPEWVLGSIGMTFGNGE